MQKLELYIHIPFCVQKCAYCDFLSAPANDAAKAEYVDALKKEIQRYREVASSYQVSSVFVGGGTPSILSCEQMGEIFKMLRQDRKSTRLNSSHSSRSRMPSSA